MTSTGAIHYKIKLHKDVVAIDSKQFDIKTKEKIKKKCKDLLSVSPNLVGEPLRFALKEYRKIKIFDNYRIIYRVDKKEALVFILAVGIRRDDDVYLEALRRLKTP